MNAVGAVGAIVGDMGLEPLLARGFMLVGRAAGLLAHLYEERQNPIGQQVWDLVLAQDPRNELPCASRSRHERCPDKNDWRNMETFQDLSLLMDPRSVVLVGASDRTGSLGQRALENIVEHSRFEGELFLVNATRDEVGGARIPPRGRSAVRAGSRHRRGAGGGGQ